MTIPARLVLLAACATLGPTACGAPTAREKAGHVGMANPASVYCASLGGRLAIRKAADGGEQGICHLPDGTDVEEWALYRRDHPSH